MIEQGPGTTPLRTPVLAAGLALILALVAGCSRKGVVDLTKDPTAKRMPESCEPRLPLAELSEEDFRAAELNDQAKEKEVWERFRKHKGVSELGKMAKIKIKEMWDYLKAEKMSVAQIEKMLNIYDLVAKKLEAGFKSKALTKSDVNDFKSRRGRAVLDASLLDMQELDAEVTQIIIDHDKWVYANLGFLSPEVYTSLAEGNVYEQGQDLARSLEAIDFLGSCTDPSEIKKFREVLISNILVVNS